MNSNGVGVPPLCFFTMTFKKAGKEVWKSSFSFCPQPSWMHMNSFVQQGLKPEQHPKPQNVKTTSRREKLFHWFQGKTQSMPHVCSFKNRKLPQSLESNVFQELLCHVFCSSKNPQSPFGAIPRFYKAQENNLRRASQKGCPVSLLNLFSEHEVAKPRRHWN